MSDKIDGGGKDPLERLRARMKKVNERPVGGTVKSKLRQAVSKKTGGKVAPPKQNKAPVSAKGGWVSIGSGKVVQEGGKYSRNVVVKVRYVDFNKSASSSTYGSAKQSTLSHIEYAKDRPAQKKEEQEREAAEHNRVDGQPSQEIGVKSDAERSTGEHLDYAKNREGVTTDHGQLFDGKEKGFDGKRFVDRASDDKRQFRMIVSPEDGAKVDLTEFTRDLMKQVEADLGTKLDWVAANHYNTDNPHTHIIVRGVRDDGKDLVMKPDYIQRGIRGRASAILDRELGLRTEHDLERDIQKSIKAERVTQLDRIIDRSASNEFGTEVSLVDVEREAGGQFAAKATGQRLHHLKEMGLAHTSDNVNFVLQRGWKDSLKKLGHRHDIYKQMSAHGYPNVVVMDGATKSESALVGKVVEKGLQDELYEKEFMLVSGTDGKVHYVSGRRSNEFKDIKQGDVVRVRSEPPKPFWTKADENILEYAKGNGGKFDESGFKLWSIEKKKLRGDAIDNYVEAHKKRLGTLSQKGFAENKLDHWVVPSDMKERITKYDEGIFRKVGNRLVVSKVDGRPVDQMLTQARPTIVDKQILGLGDHHLAKTGYGAEFSKLVKQRQQWLVNNGFGKFSGRTFLPMPKMLDALRKRDVSEQVKALNGVGSDAEIDFQATDIRGHVKGYVQTDSGTFLAVKNEINGKVALARTTGKEATGLVGKRIEVSNSLHEHSIGLPKRSKVVELTRGLKR